MNKLVEKQRKSNFELLRILAMILIILHHYSIHGGLFKIEGFEINKYIGTITYLGGKLGVNLFILISGYFLINSKFKVKKFLKLIVQVLFYTLCFFVVYVLIKGKPTGTILKKCFLPITYGTYWFITIYIGMYVLSPFINKFVKSMQQKNMLVLFGILTFMFSVLGTVTSSSKFMGNLQWFIFLYMIGAYIRLYDFPKINKKVFKFGAIVGYLLMIVVVIAITYISKNKPSTFSRLSQIIGMNYLLTFIESILIFMFFKNLDIKSNKFINLLGKTSFGVYLFHDNMFRDFFWKDIFKVENFYYSEWYLLILHIVGCTLAIYLIGTTIEVIRIKLIEEPIFKIKKFDKWFERVDKIMEIE